MHSPDAWDQHLPPLPEPYATALLTACRRVMATFAVRGLVAGGSILRGEGHTTSDLDLVVVHHDPWRQRIQFWADGVPVEGFVNPDHALRQSIALEVRAGHPVMMGLLTTGTIVFDPEGIMAALKDEARSLLAQGPQVAPAAVQARQYDLGCLLDDAVDLRDEDMDRSRAIASRALSDAVLLHFLRLGRWQPRSKALFQALDTVDPLLGAELRAVLAAWDEPGMTDRARTLLERLTGVSGFFAWESAPESRPSPQ